MKKIWLALGLFLISFQFVAAQSDAERLQEQMQRIQERMNQMMQEFSEEFGGSFNFDTTIVRQFDSRDFFGEGFPFDTSWVQEFRWDNFGDSPIRIDTFFIKEFRGFEPGERPDFFNGDAFPNDLNRMLEELMQNLQQFDGQGFNLDNMEEFFRHHPDYRKENQGEEPLRQQEAPPSNKKKRKITIL